jgi:hypothetical protein
MQKKLLDTASLRGALRTVFVLALPSVIACHSSQPTTGVTPNAGGGPSEPGARTANEAVQLFLDAVRAGDLQAMSIAWGTRDGPTRDHIPHDELEKREVILQCYLVHDSYRILGPGSNPQDGEKSFKIEITRGQRIGTTTVSTIQGPHRRWYVQNVVLADIRDFCGGQSSP